ncbi:MAG: peptidyl-tRNA hydrolase Pth2 [Candidatus Marsarchaeota archaeon]|nr:peptidyl-tRNA hydrolase Pth2 [Candidatus Marsarchaeota archaeon]MCL5112183.1 peptidyl-tRNA hydrolase Pth2 [Candidatus Marsarchaeota archaeon]
MDDEIKQVIIVRTDIEMGKGKLAAQVAHASLTSYFDAEKRDKEVAREWLDSGEKKIVLKVSDEEALTKLYTAFRFKKIPCALVSDRGLTQLPPDTKTALGIGPWHAKEIDLLTKPLKLL